MFYALCSLIAVAFSPALVGAVATLSYTGCAGAWLVFNCSATDTLLLRWVIDNNGEELAFKSINDVGYQQELPVDKNNMISIVMANLTVVNCSSNISCYMESLIFIPDGVNLTLLCQSSKNDSEMAIMNCECDAYVHVCI